MKKSAGGRWSLVAVNVDSATQEAISVLCSRLRMEVVFVTFAEFPFHEIAPNEIVLLNSTHHQDRIIENIPTIRAERPGAEVILLSRLADEQLWCKALSFGACDLLSLPLQEGDFLLSVGRAAHPAGSDKGLARPAVA